MSWQAMRLVESVTLAALRGAGVTMLAVTVAETPNQEATATVYC